LALLFGIIAIFLLGVCIYYCAKKARENDAIGVYRLDD